MSSVRNKLVNIRSQNNMTQQDIADKLGISRSFYTMIENGKRNPSLELAFKISNLLKVDVNEIFFIQARNEKLQNNKTTT
ncbi:MAG: putative transcriptional regulator [Candidatus Petromonas sp.]|jgi:putative transcriptional regulator|nr:putative transcriptional regulator [Candidatus Petromonas sp.]